jgi:hypothetical protein
LVIKRRGQKALTLKKGLSDPYVSHDNQRIAHASNVLKEPQGFFCQQLPPQPFFQAHEMLVADDQMVYELYI